MTRIAKAALRALLAVSILPVVTTVVSTSAEAANPCRPATLEYSRAIKVCVDKEAGTGRPRAYAEFQAPNELGKPDNFWVGLYQCNNSTGPDCVLISANNKFYPIGVPPVAKWRVDTSSKPYSFGHTYKACTSVSPNGVVNFCTTPVT